jgi:multidrug resistance efflux pump
MRRLGFAAVGVLMVASSTGCMIISRPAVQPQEPAAEATAAPEDSSSDTVQAVATPKPARTPQTATVTRQNITETLALDGTVSAAEQTPLTPQEPNRASIIDVFVKPGQQVKKGDLLVSIEGPHHSPADALNARIEDAKARLQAAQQKVVQDQAEQTSREEQGAQHASDLQQRKQQIVADATNALRVARDNLSRVQAGPSAADRQRLEDAVTTARATLSKAQDAQSKLMDGPDKAAISKAQGDVTVAQVALAKARTDVDTLSAGASPSAIQEAELAVTRAQAQLQAAQAAQTAKIEPNADPAVVRIQRDGAVRDAQLAVSSAQDHLAALKAPAAGYDLAAAKQRAQDAQDVLTAAQTKLSTLQGGASDTDLGTAQATVDRAQQGVSLAEAALADLNARPTQQELADAQDGVRRAQAALDAANSEPLPATNPGITDNSEVLQIQAEIENDQAMLAMTQVTAPFDGTIVAVRVRPGDIVYPLTPVAFITTPDPPIARVELGDADVDKVSVGQSATVQYGDDGAPPTSVTGKVVHINQDDTGTGAVTADVQVAWPTNATPVFGTNVQVTFSLQEKSDVLVVPKGAVRQVGDRASVQVLEGTRRRSVNVKVGIANADSTEIVSGLVEGQVVVVGAT